MSRMNELKWSKAEKAVGKRAFDMAYRRECEAIIKKLKEMVASAAEPDDLWRICDLLKEQRDRIDEKYDYRYSVLVFVFARLLKEGWLWEFDLEGFQKDKLEKIKYLSDL